MPYSAEELQFVQSRAAMNRRQICAAFAQAFGRADVSVDHIKSLCTRNGWGPGRQPWTVEDDALLRALYPDLPSTEVAVRLGRTLRATYARAKELHVGKSAAYFASPAAGRLDGVRGAGSRFKAGNVPPNKGKPMPFHPASAATRFKKGLVPHNAKPVGHERLTKDGYLQILVEGTNPYTGYQRRHVLKHKWLWEQANGPVPKGMALKSLDGDRLNTDPANWVALPLAILPRLNARHGRDYDNAPSELKPTIMAVAKIEQAVAERKRA